MLQQPCIPDNPELDDVITSFQDLSVDQWEDSYSLEDDIEDVQPAQSTTDSDDLLQLFLSGTFYTYPDNIDIKVHVHSVKFAKKTISFFLLELFVSIFLSSGKILASVFPFSYIIATRSKCHENLM